MLQIESLPVVLLEATIFNIQAIIDGNTHHVRHTFDELYEHQCQLFDRL